MKNLFYSLIILFCFLALSSCGDDGTNVNNSFQKMKITIYESYSGDSNVYKKSSEYYFDGDADGYLRRMLRNGIGNYNYKNTLIQERSNVPLPLYRYGCLIKNIEYSVDSSYFAITHIDYDNEGFINKGYLDSYSSLNKSSYLIYSREGDKLIRIHSYQDNVLFRISDFYYNSIGLCSLQVDSTISPAYIRKIYREYNDRKELIYMISGNDTTNGSVSEYFYDNDGNNIKQVSYNKVNNDTSNTRIYDWIMYKGYRMEKNKIERFEFDSNNNIIGYINPDFGKTRYKIEYTKY